MPELDVHAPTKSFCGWTNITLATQMFEQKLNHSFILFFFPLIRNSSFWLSNLPSGSLAKAGTVSTLQAPLIVLYPANSPARSPAAPEAARKLAADGVLSSGDLRCSFLHFQKPLQSLGLSAFTGCFIDSQLYHCFGNSAVPSLRL